MWAFPISIFLQFSSSVVRAFQKERRSAAFWTWHVGRCQSLPSSDRFFFFCARGCIIMFSWMEPTPHAKGPKTALADPSWGTRLLQTGLPNCFSQRELFPSQLAFFYLRWKWRANSPAICECSKNRQPAWFFELFIICCWMHGPTSVFGVVGVVRGAKEFQA